MVSDVASYHPVELSYSYTSFSDQPQTQEEPPLFFIHGYGSSKETWRTVLPALAGRTCYAIDLRGHGHSDLGHEEEFSLEALSLDIVEFCKQHGIKKAIFVAHSMGARVAVAAAAMKPDLFQGLLLVDMEMKPNPMKHKMEEKERSLLKLFQRTHNNSETLYAHLQQFGYTNARIDGFLREGRIQKIEAGERENFKVWVDPYVDALCRELISTATNCEHYFEQVASQQIPVCLLQAERESEITPEGLSWMERVHPKMRVVQVANSDHRVHKTANSAFIERVQAFYKECTQKVVNK